MSKSVNKKRYWEIDFLRGICVLLMLFDHFLFILYKVNLLCWNNVTNEFIIKMVGFSENWLVGKYFNVRKIGRFIVLVVFFIISGISCVFSRNNKKRLLKISLAAILLSICSLVVSKLINYDISIIWGVLHCYSACLLVYIPFEKIEKNHLIIPTSLFLFIMFLLYYFHPTLDNTNILMPLGIPSKNFRYAIEYFPLFKWLGFYFLGVLIGKFYYANKKNNSSFMDHIKIKPISFVGRYSIYVYLVHFLILFLVIYPIGYIK